MNINVDGVCGYADFIICAGDNLLAAGVYDRSKVKTRALACKLASRSISINYKTYKTRSVNGWDIGYSTIPLGKGRDRFYYALCTNKDINDGYLVTTKESATEDLYNYFMEKYKLPLLKEWVPYILSEAVSRRTIETFLYRTVVADNPEKEILMHDKALRLNDLIIYSMHGLDNDGLTNIVSTGLRRKEIWITQKPVKALEFTDFDDYISKYGPSLVRNIEKEIHPLVGLKGEVDTLALKHKRLYPQQAACVNGIIALKKNGVKYAIANEGMGTGKTIQGASVVDAYFVEKWLKQHPGKTLVDAYQKGVINYRAIIMAPGHLVEKWAAEIEKEIPFAKATILDDFSQLIKIRERGKKRNYGKEFFVVSKDFAKLGAQESPSPTMVKRRYVKVPVCADCLKEGKVFYLVGNGRDAVCPECGGKKTTPYAVTGMPKEEGLICPNCGELLLGTKNLRADVAKWEEDPETYPLVLKPKDFARRTAVNSTCVNCGISLWGVNSKPIDVGGEFSSLVKRPQKWHKISYFKNLHKKSTDTAFVLKGHESEFTRCLGVTEYTECQREYGPRKWAPAHFIKKYLKGYFDFCILDEVHKFEGAGTAQANAAHALIKASDFTLGLTGTIANGSAASFFFLLFMLDSGRMRKHGYTWSSADYMEFCKKYGSVQSVYEYADVGDDIDITSYNKSSRGRQITQPKPVPGISPMLFVDFLLDRCVFLDITDLSKFLPKLKEQVVTCKLPDDVMGSYNMTVSQLKGALHSPEGRGCMTSILQFGLSYPDKPYGRKNISSAYTEDLVIANVENYDEYGSLDVLLPKEEKMIDIINQELSENRNCFIYASYTGEAETNITGRLQLLIEKYCNLKGRVQIIQASSPAPLKREEWIQKRASEGVRVFITNPKCVETGLDFCFNYNGAEYNYPTLIFMQMSYEMSVIWQASRRAYRLNQREECRTYYLAYENTLQTAALEIMAAKQVATSAIQGKFSSEGLAAMAKGVDTRTKLAAAMAKNDMSSRESLENMFDALNQQNNADDDEYGSYVPPKTYYELVGRVETPQGESATEFNLLDMLLSCDEVPKVPASKEEVPDTSPAVEPVSPMTDLFSQFFGISFEPVPSDNNANAKAEEKAKEKAKKKAEDSKKLGQQTIFDLFDL